MKSGTTQAGPVIEIGPQRSTTDELCAYLRFWISRLDSPNRVEELADCGRRTPPNTDRNRLFHLVGQIRGKAWETKEALSSRIRMFGCWTEFGLRLSNTTLP